MKCLHGSGVAILPWWPQKASLGRWLSKSLKKVKTQAMQVRKQDGNTPRMSEAQEAGVAAVEEDPGKNSRIKTELLGAFRVILVKAIDNIKIIWKLVARLQFSFN